MQPPAPPLTLELYAASCLLSALVALFLGAFSWFGSRRAVARSFAALQFLVFAWSFVKYLQCRAPEPQDQLLLLRLQFVAIVLIPPVALVFGRAMESRGAGPLLRPSCAFGLLVPATTVAFAFLSSRLPFLWTDEGLGVRPLIGPSSGPWFYVHAAYGYVLVALAVAALWRRARSSAGAVRRWHFHILALLLLPFAANTFFVLFGIGRSGLDPTPAAFALSGIFIALALRRYNLFDAVPYAKDLVLAALADPILTADAEGLVAGANEEAQRLFGAAAPGASGIEGRRLEELCGLSLRDVPPGVGVEWAKEGRVFLLTAYPIPARVPRWGGSILVFRDVTERSLALRALEEREDSLRRYAFMVNASRDFMSIINRDFRYEAVNDAFCASNAVCRDDIIGRTVTELWGPEVAAAHIEPALRACFGGEFVVVHNHFAFGSGGEKDLEVSYNPFRNAAGEVTHAVVVTKDVSEYLATQRELAVARERADAANEAKSAFLASMSHEIRTPLNAVLGLTELTLGTPLDAEQRDNLETVRAAGQSLLSIINDILDISKIEAGRMRLERVDFDLPARTALLLKTFGPALAAKSLSLDLVVEADCPRFVAGDPLRFGQILLNLVGNAVKFTERGGVLVTLARARGGPCGPAAAGGPDGEAETALPDRRSLGVEVSVRDTGIGIARDKLELIFESFSQADSSVSRRFGGTGLGLSICRSLSALFGGGVRVESEPGAGSTFSFSAWFEPGDPAAAGAERAAEAAAAGAALRRRGEGRAVLLVEDTEVNAKVAGAWLAREGYRWVRAASGEEALIALAGRRFDAVLMDVEMPGLDGLETCRRIRAGASGPEAAAVPVIAMTAHSAAEARAACADAGMDGFVAKPVDFALLGAALAAAIRGEEAPEAAPSLTSAGAAEGRLVDPAGPLARLEDEELYRELLGIFAAEGPERAAGLRRLGAELGAAGPAGLGGPASPQAAASGPDLRAAGPAVELRRAAHAVKGSARTVGAEPLARLAGLVEEAARAAAEAGGTPPEAGGTQPGAGRPELELGRIEELASLLEASAREALRLLGGVEGATPIADPPE